MDNPTGIGVRSCEIGGAKLEFAATSTGECLATGIKREDGAPLATNGNPVTAPATVNESVSHLATAQIAREGD